MAHQYWLKRRDDQGDLLVWDGVALCFIVVDKDAPDMGLCMWFRPAHYKDYPDMAPLDFREPVPEVTPFPSPPKEWDGNPLRIEWPDGALRPELPSWAFEPYQFWLCEVTSDGDHLMWDMSQECYIIVAPPAFPGAVEVDLCFQSKTVRKSPTEEELAAATAVNVNTPFPSPPEFWDGELITIAWGEMPNRPHFPEFISQEVAVDDEEDWESEPGTNPDPIAEAQASGALPPPVTHDSDPFGASVAGHAPEEVPVTTSIHPSTEDPDKTMIVAPLGLPSPAQAASVSGPGNGWKASAVLFWEDTKEVVSAISKSWPAICALIGVVIVGILGTLYATWERPQPEYKPRKVYSDQPLPIGMAPKKKPVKTGMTARQVQRTPPAMKRPAPVVPDASSDDEANRRKATEALKQKQKGKAERERKAKLERQRQAVATADAEAKRKREARAERKRKRQRQRRRKRPMKFDYSSLDPK
jgi:hypothetical protein